MWGGAENNTKKGKVNSFSKTANYKPNPGGLNLPTKLHPTDSMFTFLCELWKRGDFGG